MSLPYLVLAALAGAVLCYLVLRERIRSQQKQLDALEPVRAENSILLARVGELKGRLETVDAAKTEMTKAFRSASSEVFAESSRQFLNLAEQRFERLKSEAAGDLTQRELAIQALVNPLRDALNKVESQVSQVERERIGAYSVLTSQVSRLQVEASKLATALASPSARGRWGEIQLRRVVEIAGMLEYCDFLEQSGIPNAETRLRPDLTIQLPNEKKIVVDSKVPLTAYLAACECNDEVTRRARLEEHARQVRSHIKALASKAYSAQLPSSPEFVVAFLPGEIFFSAALEVDGELLEFGVQHNVILATPTTLIALLKAVAYGWKQEQVARNAQEIKKLGVLLYDRVRIFAEHYESIGKSLRSAQDVYQKGRISLENRLLITARKFEDFGIGPTSAGALPEPLPFNDALGFSVGDDEGGSDSGRGGEPSVARRA